MQVNPGEVWTWQEPGGRTREMLVERIQLGPKYARAYGCHPRSRRPLQCRLSILTNGQHGACRLAVVDGFVYDPKAKKKERDRLRREAKASLH